MSIKLLILPIHLYEYKYLPDVTDIVIWEHPHYFKKYIYNKKKLLLHKASLYYYKEYLSKKYNVTYVTYDKKPNLKNYMVFNPVDKIDLPKNARILESPNFLLTIDQYNQYREKTDKFFFNAFYMWAKKELDILPNVKSTDKENRNKMPNNVVIPDVPSNKNDMKYINKMIDVINSEFENNYGDTDDFIFPVTHSTAKKWLKDFVKYKLNNFGKYQDAIKKDQPYLNHSLLSSSLNIGLLHPSDVIDEVIKQRTSMNNKEGLIRQLFWREYQHYTYLYFNFNGNYFGNKKKLSDKWYNGTTGFDPIDDSINIAFKTGYLHHIIRLMVIGNFMNLNSINPKEGFKWFMEFSIDSYEWVMHQNVYEMVFFISGGGTMRRPYITSSNYIKKMSDYKTGDWSKKWDNLYSNFLEKNKEKLYKFRYYFPGLKKIK